MRSVFAAICVVTLAICGCSYASHSPSFEGETHWLKTCEDGSVCGANGTCICGVCTTSCKDDADCASHDPDAVCANSLFTSLADGCSGEDISLVTNLCVLPCGRDADCSVDDASLICASDLCVDVDHDLAKEQPLESCPDNPDFQCTDETPREIVTDEAYLDENGCLLRRCEEDGDCLEGESCYVSARYADCYFPLWQCEDYEIGDGCGCATLDYDIPVACEAGYCMTPKRTTRCPSEVGSDPVDVLDAQIEGDVVTLSVGHSGGCEKHNYALCYTGEFLESYPVQAPMHLIHDAGGDTCDAYLEQELHFDLTPLKEEYQKAYHTESGIIESPFGLYGFEALSCEERSRVAGERIRQAAEWADRTCETDIDCISISNSIENCSKGCGTIVSASNGRGMFSEPNGQAYFEHRLEVIQETVCGDVEADGCFVAALPCAPVGPPACINGECASLYDEVPDVSTEPRQLTTLGDPGDDTVTLHLFVSNQSSALDPVDIDIAIDGVPAVEGEFRVEGSHNWYRFDFYLAAGEHVVSAETEVGEVSMTWDFAIAADEHWAVIDFWLDSERGAQPYFSWDLQDTPFIFA